jgi:hypothetical protein
MSRSEDLIKQAIKALEDMRDPFSHEFLVENAVTADECFNLSDQMALGLRMVLTMRSEMRAGGLAAKVAAHRLVDAAMVQAD